jgi:hypothetical protein
MVWAPGCVDAESGELGWGSGAFVLRMMEGAGLPVAVLQAELFALSVYSQLLEMAGWRR